MGSGGARDGERLTAGDGLRAGLCNQGKQFKRVSCGFMGLQLVCEFEPRQQHGTAVKMTKRLFCCSEVLGPEADDGAGHESLNEQNCLSRSQMRSIAQP